MTQQYKINIVVTAKDEKTTLADYEVRVVELSDVAGIGMSEVYAIAQATELALGVDLPEDEQNNTKENDTTTSN